MKRNRVLGMNKEEERTWPMGGGSGFCSRQAARTAQRPSALLRACLRFEETRGKRHGRTEGRRSGARMGWTADGERGEAGWRLSQKRHPPSQVFHGQLHRVAQGGVEALGERHVGLR